MVSNLIIKVFENIWPMLVVFTVAISLIRFFYLRTHREKFQFYKEINYLISIIYIWLLFEILTMSETNRYGGMNLVPFSEILRYDFGSTLFNYNVFGNIIIFIPFGYLIGEYVKPKKVWPVLITTFITSMVVEFVQLEIGRSFDIDDILLNLIGGLIGYLLYIGISAICKHLPDFLKSDFIKNLLWLILIILFGLYIYSCRGILF